jgi:hypothetical protein
MLLKLWITNPKSTTQLLSLTETIWNLLLHWKVNHSVFVLHFRDSITVPVCECSSYNCTGLHHFHVVLCSIKKRLAESFITCFSIINLFHSPSCLCSRERRMYNSADRHFQRENEWFQIIWHSVFCNVTLKDNSGGFYVIYKKKTTIHSLKWGITSITARSDAVVWLMY